jgi:hypothetical protein
VGFLEAADRRPVHVVVGFFAVSFVGLLAWGYLDGGPVLLAGAKPDHRTVVYGQLSQSAVGMLAVSLTVLAILTALPDRRGVQDLRGRRAWRLLLAGLAATAGLCLVCLIAAHLGGALDNGADGKEWLSSLTIASAVSAIVSLLVFGAAFTLALPRAHDPPDPMAVRTDD